MPRISRLADASWLRSAARLDRYERKISKHPILGFVSFVIHAVVVFLNPSTIGIDLLGDQIPVVALTSTLYLLFDPLFLFAPLINVGTKCLVIDNNLKITALVLRSWGDLRYLSRIYRRSKDGQWKDLNQRMLGLPGEILAVLPIPQVAILVFLPNMRGSNSLKIMWFLDSLIVLQYIRVYPLYLLCKSWNTWNIGVKQGFKLPNWSLIFINIYGMQGSSNFFQKWLQCFSWGIRNLSSYGSNLTDASVNEWENLFVILVSISGLVLFMYLLGFVQEFMKKVDKLKTIEQTMEINDSKLQSIIFPTYGFSDYEMKKKIKLAVKEKLREDENYIVENMFSILSLTQARSFAPEIKRTIFLDKLKKVDGLNDKGDEVLKQICEQLEPMIYIEDSCIIREGEPLHMTFFITGGSVLTYTTNNGGLNGSSGTIQLEKERDDLYGEELITWVERPCRKLSNLPISPITVKCLNKVEIFALKATEIISHFNMGNVFVVVE